MAGAGQRRENGVIRPERFGAGGRDAADAIRPHEHELGPRGGRRPAEKDAEGEKRNGGAALTENRSLTDEQRSDQEDHLVAAAHGERSGAEPAEHPRMGGRDVQLNRRRTQPEPTPPAPQKTTSASGAQRHHKMVTKWVPARWLKFDCLDQLPDFFLEGVGEIRPGQRVGDVGGEKADLGTAVERLAFVFQSIEGLALQKRNHCVGDLNLAARSLLLRRQNIEDFRLEDVAAENGEIGGLGARLRLLDHAVDRKHAPVAFTDRYHAIKLDLILRHGLNGDDVAAMLGINVEHLGETALAFRLHQDIGKEERERLIADELARAPYGMTEAEWLLLAGEAGRAWPGQVLIEKLELSSLAARGENLLEFELPVEMIFDDPLVSPGDEDEVLDACFLRFVHDMLDQRPIDDRQHFLRHGFGGGEKAGAKPRDGEHSLAHAMRHLQSSLTLR